MATYKLIYKNGVTPQEYLTENSRWYLDSDVGKNSSGIASITYSSRTYQKDYSITTVAVSLGTGKDFLYIENQSNSADDILLSLDGGVNYHHLLSSGESFASKLDSSANIYVKSIGKSDIEYFVVT